MSRVAIEYKGETKSISEWARTLGFKPYLISMRLRAGWSVSRALTTPARRRIGLITWRGESKTAAAWSRQVGICRRNITCRLSLGWSVERALTIPAKKRMDCYRYCGKFYSLHELAAMRQIKVATLRTRLRTHTIEEALDRPRLNGKVVEFRGSRRNLADWAKRLGINRRTLAQRLNRGWSIERAFFQPTGRKRKSKERIDGHRLELNGESMTIPEWSRKTGINKLTIWHRIYKAGWSVERALTTPARIINRKPRTQG